MSSSNFSSLRKSRSTLLNKLASTAKEQNSKQTQKDDERFWKLSTNEKTGVGYARLRFLPPVANEDVAWARIFNHGFQGPSGSWYIENCLTTLSNRPCPVCKSNNGLWNSGVEADKDVARTRKRRLQYISNILVIEDPVHPENNGKNFLFRYGKKIHDKIMEQIEPQFPDQQPTNPFDMWEGCDFKLKSIKASGFLNYDKSAFDAPSELFATEKDKEAKQEALWNAEYPLAEFTAEAQFKSYEVLETRLNAVLSGTDAPRSAAARVEQEQSLEGQDDKPVTSTPEAPKAVRQPRTPRASAPAAPVAKVAPVAPPPPSDDDEDGLKDFFSKAGLMDDDEQG